MAALLAASVLVMTPAVAGQASEEDARCDGRVPSRAQEALEDAIHFREQFGLPRTPDYVRRVLRNPRYRRLGSEYGSPLTPPEVRYLRRRDRFDRRATEVQSEARRLARDAYAGVSIEDDFPRGPYVAVRFTRDHQRLGAEIQRKVGARVRARPAEFTLAELNDAEREISRRLGDPAEQEELDRQDVSVTGWSVDEGRNRVVLDVISARADIAEFVPSRYGPRAAGHVTATERFSTFCVPIDAYRITNGGRTLKLHYTANTAYRAERVEVVERDDRVTVAAFERGPNGPVTLAATERVVTAQLSQPLAGRRVVDAETGRSLPLIRDGVPRSWRAEP